jgi:hypothetical protein
MNRQKRDVKLLLHIRFRKIFGSTFIQKENDTTIKSHSREENHMSTNGIIILDCIITALVALCFYYRCENYTHNTRRENAERRKRELQIGKPEAAF